MVTRNRVGTQAVSGVTAANTQNGGSGGSGGTSGSDNRVPSGPTVLTPSNLGVNWQAGAYLGTVTLTWTLPTTATDGSAMAPATSHLYQASGTSGAFSQVTVLDYPDHSVVLSGYAPNSTWQFKVRCVAANGKVSAFSNIVTVAMPNSSAAGPPGAPSTPEVDPEGIVIRVRWDGLGLGGVPMAADFQYCAVQRAHSAAFATSDTVPVGTLITAGDYYDGPLTPGDTWYYRLVPYNMLDAPGTPSESVPVTVGEISGGDIADGTIGYDQMESDLMALVSQAAGNAPGPGDAIPGSHVFYGNTPPAAAVPNDLWFNGANNNTPMILQGLDPTVLSNWVAYRDKIVNDAFSGAADDTGTPGTTIQAPYLLPSVVRGKIIEAQVINAGDVIARNSITSDLGLFGNVDAAIITSGYIDAKYIHSDTIDTTKLVVADLANLCDEPEFDGAVPTSPDTFVPQPGVDYTKDPSAPLMRVKGTPLNPPWKPIGWNDPNAAPTGNNGRRSITDHPTANNTTGYVYSIIGLSGGAKQTIRNIRTFPALRVDPAVVPGGKDDQFFGQLWVRKIGAGTTGTVTFALEVDLKGGGTTDPTTSSPKTVFFSKTFTTADPPTQWTSLPLFTTPPQPLGQNGQIAPDNSQATNPKPSDPNKPWTPNTQALPAGAFQARASIIVTNLALGQEIQIASVWVRRKNNASLIVDGCITADQIMAGTITGAEIHADTIHSTNIGAGEIYSINIHTGTIQADDMRADALTAFIVNGGTLRTSDVTVDTSYDPPKIVAGAKYPYFEISKTQMIYQTAAPPVAPQFQFSFVDGPAGSGITAGQMSWQSNTGTASKWVLSTDGLYFYGTQGVSAPPVIALSVNAKTIAGKPFAAGSGYFQGDLTGSKFTAGSNTSTSYLQSSSSGARVVMDSTGLKFFNATATNPVLSLLETNTSALITSKPDHLGYGDFATGWYIGPSGIFFDGQLNGTGPQKRLFYLNASDGSATFSGALKAATVDADTTITGATIQTDTTAPRIVMQNVTSPVGAIFRMYDQYASPMVTFQADKSTSTAAFVLDSNPQMMTTSNIGHGAPRLLINSSSYFRFYNGKKDPDGSWTVPLNIDFVSGSISLTGTLSACTVNGGTINAATFQTTSATGAVDKILINTNGIYEYQSGHVVSSWTLNSGLAFKSTYATTGPRMYIDSGGIRAIDGSNNYTFQIAVDSGAATFAGNLNAAGGSFTGNLSAAGGSFRGDITAATGSFNGIITGKINGVEVTSGTNTNDPGATWNGGSYGGSPQFNIGGGWVQTSGGANRVVLISDQIQIYANNHLSGIIYGYTASDDLMVKGGASTDSVWLGLNTATNFGGGLFQVANAGFVNSAALRESGTSTVAGWGQLYVQQSGAGRVAAYTSSRRFKTKIAALELDPRFMAIETATWDTLPNLVTMQTRYSHPGGRNRNTGFTAENLHRIGMADAVNYDAHRQPYGVQQPAIMAHTVRYTQWLVNEVNELRARLAALEGAHA